MNFPDLDSTHWAYTAVQFMVQKGVVKGYDDGTFKPNNSVRRGEFAKMLVLALDLPTVQPAAPTFADVDSSK